MKKIIAAIVLALVIVWGVGIQQADAGYMDPVSFFVVDDNDDPAPAGDDSVTLSITNINIGGASLQYSLDNIAWANTGASFTVLTGPGDWKKVYMRLLFADTTTDTGGIVTFSGPEGDLFNAVFIKWNPSISLSIAVAEGDDNVAPVPIPGAVW
ncbi:MAG: hypothetical protein KAT09_09190, partial [Candidatus Aegiribacteria sp.]|nr:hypothetical protein [Candidatus Aegiribacteria sp.]